MNNPGQHAIEGMAYKLAHAQLMHVLNPHCQVLLHVLPLRYQHFSALKLFHPTSTFMLSPPGQHQVISNFENIPTYSQY